MVRTVRRGLGRVPGRATETTDSGVGGSSRYDGSMSEATWQDLFRAVYQRARRAYEGGAGTPEACVTGADLKFLDGIGCSAQELFDLVEDDVTMGEPGPETAMKITAVRREYYLDVEKGRAPERVMQVSEFPSRQATLGGIPWLPRILKKAQGKLRGQLPAELMYCCGGDRQFLKAHGLEPDAFLRAVWRAGGGADADAAILEYVQRRGVA